MEKLFALQFIHTTEMAAIAAAREMGKGDKKLADGKAVEAMREELNKIEMRGRVVIGEGERDKAPMLFIGETLGQHKEAYKEIDIAVDPLENTNATANGTNNAISVLAASEKGGLLHAPDIYMDKLVVGKESAGKVHLDASVKENLKNVAKDLERDIQDLVVVILDRERNEEYIARIREAGARCKIIADGDLTGGITAMVRGAGVHVLMGIGAAPEGVLTAAAARCLGGEMQGRFWLKDKEEKERLTKMGIKDHRKIFKTEELAQGENIIFSATGVTNGDLLSGVRFFGGGARTHTLITSTQSQKIRFIDTTHVFDSKEITFRL